MDTRMPEVPITPPVQVVPTTRSGVRARHHKHFLEGFFAIFLAIQGPVEYTYCSNKAKMLCLKKVQDVIEKLVH